ncbi:OLC1v1003162C1 [Oldenlandia corymbosa var. corymbosa]|uniref:OLC1v1003162C1 n=1 Tax=Oldenlandia corymbosa var. corymbosa TaxID=529605 RepID=A0AAV1DB90_OLDCO|nr:OLC1v1003162C1 [Oldenlandia corymbosa var. corymbosa]
MNDQEQLPVVIGGMVLDIDAIPSVPSNPRTTTPGKVNYALGGVARNVAECMSKLGAKPYMISAVGLDMAGNMLLDQWKSAQLCTEDDAGSVYSGVSSGHQCYNLLELIML